jgi:hypothetical protein
VLRITSDDVKSAFYQFLVQVNIRNSFIEQRVIYGIIHSISLRDLRSYCVNGSLTLGFRVMNTFDVPMLTTSAVFARGRRQFAPFSYNMIRLGIRVAIFRRRTLSTGEDCIGFSYEGVIKVLGTKGRFLWSDLFDWRNALSFGRLSDCHLSSSPEIGGSARPPSHDLLHKTGKVLRCDYRGGMR